MITKERITSIISKVPFNANELLSYLKNNEYLKTLYETRYRHYLLEEHTLLVIKQFQLYFSAFLPDAEKSFMYLMLAFHDIGKPLSIKSQQSQYKSTISVIDSLKDYLPVNIEQYSLMIALISNDPIGLYMQDKISLDTALGLVEDMQRMSKSPKLDFIKLLIIYYQCDIASYTKDAGGKQFLEYLFKYSNGFKVIKPTTNRLLFSDQFESKFKILYERIIL